MDILEWTKSKESFDGMPYRDAGGLSVGYGTHLPITKREGDVLCSMRLQDKADELDNALMGWRNAPPVIQFVLQAMAYQMGTDGVMEFHDMIHAYHRGDWRRFQAEMLNSEWARVQTPDRAMELAKMLDPLINGEQP